MGTCGARGVGTTGRGGASPSVKLLDASESVSLSHGWNIEEHVVVVLVVVADDADAV
jgi:hypothetical protein